MTISQIFEQQNKRNIIEQVIFKLKEKLQTELHNKTSRDYTNEYHIVYIEAERNIVCGVRKNTLKVKLRLKNYK